jgi:hypothetical protein
MRFVSRSGPPDDEDQERFRRMRLRQMKPDNQIPVTVGTAILLGRTDELAVAVSDLKVYRNGLAFTVSARSRGGVALAGAFLGHRPPWQREPADPFLLGFEFADGRSVSNLRGWPGLLDLDDEATGRG